MPDPTAHWHRTKGCTDQRTRFTDLPPPRDPVLVARQEGRLHYNQATGTTLYPQSPCPVGEHIGKDMARIPKADLRRYARCSCLDQWPEWRPVRDYLTRFPPL